MKIISPNDQHAEFISCCDGIRDAGVTTASDVPTMFWVSPRTPFQKSGHNPGLYILSDDGHGGWCEAAFCPFCGTRVEIER